MLSSISPVGEISRKQRWGITVTAYVLGSVVAGGLLGLLLGWTGEALPGQMAASTRLALIGGVAILGVVVDATVGVPTLHRQVDERWLTEFRGWVYGLGFGLQLGTGILTIMPSSIVLTTWIGVVIGADPLIGAITGLTFGAARAAPLVVAGRVRTVSALRRTLRWMDTVRPSVRRSMPWAQGVIGVAAVATLGLG
ncbi:hypothetical protein [Euzebya tangerina]|uniref:hypothetical protein n=1 Tax=Euzebya tangerina TaxID=591198 RepID=UPI000E30CF43|nr:hypothetical protein [Euzebya tangerina]